MDLVRITKNMAKQSIQFVFCSTLIVFGFLILVENALGQVTEKQTSAYDPNESYCFRFTWLGPEFNNGTIVNTTCAIILDEIRTNNVPCRSPLLVTDNGAPPDINFLWENHREKVLCRQAQGQVCAKYSYSFNNKVQNVTYMCVKVSTTGKGAVTSGCYGQKENEYDVELCVCQSSPGVGKPCNGSPSNFITIGLLMYSLIFAIKLI